MVSVSQENTSYGLLYVVGICASAPQSTLKVKIWKNPGSINPGDLMEVQGKIKKYQGESFLNVC